MTAYRSRLRRQIITPRVTHGIFDALLEDGTPVTITGKRATEFYTPLLQLRDPQDRVFTDRARHFNVAAAVALLSSSLVQVPDGWTAQFMGQTDHPSVEDITLWPTSFAESGMPPYHLDRYVLEQLKASLEWLGEDSTQMVGPDVATSYNVELDLHWKVRDRMLNLYVTANGPTDVVRDMPYDLFMVAGLHEFMARRAYLPLGDIVFSTSSLYLLDTDRPQVKKLARQRWPFKSAPMPVLTDDDLERYRVLITQHLTSATFNDVIKRHEWTTPAGIYLLNWACVLRSFLFRTDSPVAAMRAHDQLKDPTLKTVLRQWLTKAGAITTPVPPLGDLEDLD